MTRDELSTAAELRKLIAQDLTAVKWTKSALSAGGTGDCLEVARVDGGWILRSTVLPECVIPLTNSEYEAYVGGVRAGQPGLVP
ncbi:DUF397 domain-containing protein [Streptomyces sp. NPDC088261]|uniref:DUF397 domain-containing protein n=1 Tax=Streptomyces sp. NPDC088261 TaxID=3365851 RepID=UPI00380A7692